MGHKKMTVKVRMEPAFYESLRRCTDKMGYSSVSEFCRLSIREKINRECGEHFIEAIVIEYEKEEE